MSKAAKQEAPKKADKYTALQSFKSKEGKVYSEGSEVKASDFNDERLKSLEDRKIIKKS